MASDLESLVKLGADDGRKFVHGVIDGLCEKAGVQYDQYAAQLTLSEYTKLKTATAKTVKQESREGIDQQKVLKRLCSQGLSQEIAGLLAECLWVRKEEIRDELVRQSCAISHSYLADYDWKMKLVLSSDKLSSVQEPLVSLHLDLNEEGEKRSEDIELSKEELGKLISSLDTANKAVLQLRT